MFCLHFCHVNFKDLTILYLLFFFFFFLIFDVLVAFSSSEFHEVNFMKDMAKICNKNCTCSSPQALAAP